MSLLVSKLRSVTVREDGVATSSAASHHVLARKVVSYRSHGVAARKVEQTPPIGNRELIQAILAGHPNSRRASAHASLVFSVLSPETLSKASVIAFGGPASTIFLLGKPKLSKFARL